MIHRNTQAINQTVGVSIVNEPNRKKTGVPHYSQRKKRTASNQKTTA